MLQVKCQGTPFEIGQQHGAAATVQIKRSMAFYESFFGKNIHKSWSEVQDVAKGFLPYLQASWPDYIDEMKGIAEGAGVDFESILAMNVRTEIGYGLLIDGCTAFAWKTDNDSFIGQNWDWELVQIQNLINLCITQPGQPSISIITEAGILGKIGLNSAGVGVTLNAMKAPGVNMTKLPTHLALRTVLNSTSANAARERLLKEGLAAACHITIADTTSGGVGLECTSEDIIEIPMENGICTHSNHMLRPHAVADGMLLADSPFRVNRVQQLLGQISQPSVDSLRNVLKDEDNYPTSICRAEDGAGTISTLFSIVMDLKRKTAIVKMGRPTENGEEVTLIP